MLFYNLDHFIAHPENILSVWQGGMSFHGGLAGCALGLAISARRHGEAVAVGMALDLIYAKRIGLLPEPVAERILGIIQQLGFELYAPIKQVRADQGRKDMLDGLEEFREHLGGRLTIPMIRAPGDRLDVHEMDGAVVKASFDELRARYG